MHSLTRASLVRQVVCAAVKKGDKLPAFTLPDQNGRKVNVKAGGKPKVIFFYPKDATPGCTLEAKAFNDALPKLKKVADVYGISSDDVASHKSFCTDLGLNFQLLVGDLTSTVVRSPRRSHSRYALRSFVRSPGRRRRRRPQDVWSPGFAVRSAARSGQHVLSSTADRSHAASLTRAPRFARSPGYVVDKSGEVISVLDDQFKPEKHVSNAMSALGVN